MSKNQAMKQFPLGKQNKLCGDKRIDSIFADGAAMSALAYPLRAVWKESDSADCSRFLVSVPKKKLRHAVDRVTMRRRVREAYRLNHSAYDGASSGGFHKDIVFVYIADKERDYSRVESAMKKLLSRIHESK